MTCPRCGSELPTGAARCPRCSTARPDAMREAAARADDETRDLDRERRRQAEALSAGAQLLLETLDTDRICDRLVEGLLAVTPAYSAAVRLIENESEGRGPPRLRRGGTSVGGCGGPCLGPPLSCSPSPISGFPPIETVAPALYPGKSMHDPGVPEGQRAAAGPLRVLLAEDDDLVRANFRTLLDSLASVTVVGEARNGREAVALCEALAPDVVLMDLAMPELGGIEAMIQMLRVRPGTRVIMLSLHGGEVYVGQALHAGAAGYLLKSADAEELEEALEAVRRGEFYLSPGLMKPWAPVRRLPRPDEGNPTG